MRLRGVGGPLRSAGGQGKPDVARVARETKSLLQAAAEARKAAALLGVLPCEAEEASCESSLNFQTEGPSGLLNDDSAAQQQFDSKRDRLYRHLARTLPDCDGAAPPRRRPRLSLGVKDAVSEQSVSSPTAFEPSTRRRSCAAAPVASSSQREKEFLENSAEAEATPAATDSAAFWQQVLLKRKLRLERRSEEIRRRQEEQLEHQTLLSRLAVQTLPPHAEKSRIPEPGSGVPRTEATIDSSAGRLLESPRARLASVSPRPHLLPPVLSPSLPPCGASRRSARAARSSKRSPTDDANEPSASRRDRASWLPLSSQGSRRPSVLLPPRQDGTGAVAPASVAAGVRVSGSLFPRGSPTVPSEEAVKTALSAAATSVGDVQVVLRLLRLLTPMQLATGHEQRDSNFAGRCREALRRFVATETETEAETPFSCVSPRGLLGGLQEGEQRQRAVASERMRLIERSQALASSLRAPLSLCGFACQCKENPELCAAALANSVDCAALTAAAEEEAFSVLHSEVLDEKFRWYFQLRREWAAQQAALAREADEDGGGEFCASLFGGVFSSSSSPSAARLSFRRRRGREEAAWAECVRTTTARVADHVLGKVLASSTAASVEAAAFPVKEFSVFSEEDAAAQSFRGASSLCESMEAGFSAERSFSGSSGRSAVWKWLWNAGSELGFCVSSRFAALQLLDAYTSHPSFPFQCVCLPAEGENEGEAIGPFKRLSGSCSLCCSSREMALCASAALLLAASLRCHWKDIRTDTFLHLLQIEPARSLFSEDDVIAVQADMLQLLPPSAALGMTASDSLCASLAALRDLPLVLRHAPQAAAQFAVEEASSRVQRRKPQATERRNSEPPFPSPSPARGSDEALPPELQQLAEGEKEKEKFLEGQAEAGDGGWGVVSAFDFWKESGLLVVLHELVLRCCASAAEGGLLLWIPPSKFAAVALLSLMRCYCQDRREALADAPEEQLRLEDWERCFCLFVLKSRYEADFFFWKALIEPTVRRMLLARPQRQLLSLWKRGALQWRKLQSTMAARLLALREAPRRPLVLPKGQTRWGLDLETANAKRRSSGCRRASASVAAHLGDGNCEANASLRAGERRAFSRRTALQGALEVNSVGGGPFSCQQSSLPSRLSHGASLTESPLRGVKRHLTAAQISAPRRSSAGLAAFASRADENACLVNQRAAAVSGAPLKESNPKTPSDGRRFPAFCPPPRAAFSQAASQPFGD